MHASRAGIRDELPRARELARRFEAKLGVAPEGVWAAPGRVNLIGEHTDYNEGFALPLGIEQRALVAVRRRNDPELRLESLQTGSTRVTLSELKPGQLSGWAAYVAGSAWAAIEDGARGTGLDLLLDSDVPIGAGLSSSAAVECASLVALAELWGFSRSKVQLARLAQRAEIEVAGVPCGLMDQLTSMCAEPRHALRLDFRSFSVEPLALPLEAAGLELLVIDTRSPHQLADGDYAERRRSCQEAARILGVTALRDATPELLADAGARLDATLQKRARHVITEDARVLAAVAVLREAGGQAAPGQADSPLCRLGPILSASHASLRDDFQVSVPRLDVAAAAAEGAGALGARMIGGGFGGSVLALVRGAEFDAVCHAVMQAFAAQAWAEPRLFHALAGAGAGRLL
jgi:galactokinase